jgi:hypothetical protein
MALVVNAHEESKISTEELMDHVCFLLLNKTKEKPNSYGFRLACSCTYSRFSSSGNDNQDVYRSMAGSETTSQTLGYALWELAKNHAVQDKLRAELMSMPSNLTYEDIQSATKLPYLVSCSFLLKAVLQSAQ